VLDRLALATVLLNLLLVNGTSHSGKRLKLLTKYERERRAREARGAHGEARLEADYSRGDDYVSQSRAALRDHRWRQRAAEASRRMSAQ